MLNSDNFEKKVCENRSSIADFMTYIIMTYWNQMGIKIWLQMSRDLYDLLSLDHMTCILDWEIHNQRSWSLNSDSRACNTIMEILCNQMSRLICILYWPNFFSSLSCDIFTSPDWSAVEPVEFFSAFSAYNHTNV